jgi:glycopeptide antibiotics resistance protein
MDFLNFIEKLQKKPESSRKKILLATLFVIMGIIIAVWLTTFNLRFKTDQMKKIGAPLEFIKEDIRDFYGFFKNITK